MPPESTLKRHPESHAESRAFPHTAAGCYPLNLAPLVLLAETREFELIRSYTV